MPGDPEGLRAGEGEERRLPTPPCLEAGFFFSSRGHKATPGVQACGGFQLGAGMLWEEKWSVPPHVITTVREGLPFWVITSPPGKIVKAFSKSMLLFYRRI